MAILKGYIISKNQLDNITDKTVKIDIDNDGTIWFYNKSNGTNMKTIKEIKIANTLKLYIHKLKNNNNTPIEIEEIELINILKNYFDYELSEENFYTEVFYKEQIDEKGNLYGKELLTDIILPIAEKQEVYYINIISNNDYNKLEVTRKQKISHKNIEELYYGIQKKGIATEYDIEEYKQKYNGFFGKYKLNKWKETLKNYAKKNLYLNEENLKEKEEPNKPILLKQDKLIEYMELIEYLLLKLKNRNIELYNKYQEEYNEVLKNTDNELNTQPLTIQTLVELEAKIEFSLHFETLESENILNNLNNLKEEYLINIINENEINPQLTIKDLDKISELFLTISKKYSPQERREIIKSISLLYLLEVYQQRNTIKEEDLINSYFKNNLRTIMINIEELKEQGIINENIYIDLETDLTTENILYLIKKIEITKNHNKVKKLIKE